LKEKKDTGYSKEGLLEKLSYQSLLVGYQRRFVTLENRELVYYEMTKQGNMKRCGRINFDLYSVRIEVLPEMEGFRLSLLNCDRTFTFRSIQNQNPNAKKEMKSWIDAILYHLEGSAGKMRTLKAPASQEFWRLQ